MRRYWLLDQHGDEGPTALVETDGSLHIVDVLRFGPGITELEDQQEIWDQVIGRVAPTMKPLVDAGSLDVEGEAPDDELHRGGETSARSRSRANQRGGARQAHRAGGGRHGPNRSGSSGPR